MDLETSYMGFNFTLEQLTFASKRQADYQGFSTEKLFPAERHEWNVKICPNRISHSWILAENDD